MTTTTLEQAIFDGGGFTYNPIYNIVPTRGFAVSLEGYEEVFRADDFYKGDLRDFALRHANLLTNKNYYIGGWKDGDKVYLDVSIVVDTEIRGIMIGINNNQKAIYCLHESRTIYL